MWPCDRHHHAALDRRRPVGVGGVDPFAAAVRGPAHQLQARRRRRGRGRRKASRDCARAPGRSRRRARRRRRRSRSPARPDIAPRPAVKRRPRAATNRGRRQPGRGCAAARGTGAGARAGCDSARRHKARLRHELDRLDRFGRRHRACRSRRRSTAARSPSACHWRCSSVGSLVDARQAKPRRRRCTAAQARRRSSSPDAASGERKRASSPAGRSAARGLVASTPARCRESRLKPA